VFAPRTADTYERAKGKEAVVQIPIPNQGMQDMHLSPKVGVTHEEAEEFLRITKKSDYKVVDQLNQTPSKIFHVISTAQLRSTQEFAVEGIERRPYHQGHNNRTV
jgi:hypothetical protein